MQKITVFLPDGESVTEKDMYYLYHHVQTGTFSLDYRTRSAGLNVTITSHDFTHMINNLDEVTFHVAACAMSRINKLPDYGMFVGNQLEKPLIPDHVD